MPHFLDKTFDFETIQSFGQTGLTISHRLAQLEGAARTYFIRKPDQDNEGDVRALIVRARLLANDRHKVAHGVVNEVIIMLYDDEEICCGTETKWLLQAPQYAVRRLNFQSNIGLDSRDVLAFNESFHKLANDAETLSLRLIDREKLERVYGLNPGTLNYRPIERGGASVRQSLRGGEEI